MKEPKRGDRVLVWDRDESKAVETIYLCTIEGAAYPIRGVNCGYEEEFKSGQPFHTLSFKHMKPIAPEITVGKWYKKDRYLMAWNGGKRTYGFYRGDWSDRWSLLSADNLVEATKEEVEEALIAEAKRRGYKEGQKIISVLFPLKNYNGGKPAHNGYKYDGETLFYGGIAIFDNGKWAKIVEPQNEDTVEELEEIAENLLRRIKDLKIKK